MSKSKQIILLSIISFLIFTFVIIISCEKPQTGGGMEFQPGTYAGTYQVQRSPYDPPKVDTMKFMFYAGGGFFMLKDTVFVGTDTLYDWERLFCNVNGEFEIIGPNDRLRIYIDSNFIYYNTCVHEENPSDDYTRTYQGEWIIFTGDDTDYRRKIILWEMMEN